MPSKKTAPVVLAIAIGLAVLYGIGYVIYALLTGR